MFVPICCFCGVCRACVWLSLYLLIAVRLRCICGVCIAVYCGVASVRSLLCSHIAVRLRRIVERALLPFFIAVQSFSCGVCRACVQSLLHSIVAVQLWWAFIAVLAAYVGRAFNHCCLVLLWLLHCCFICDFAQYLSFLLLIHFIPACAIFTESIVNSFRALYDIFCLRRVWGVRLIVAVFAHCCSIAACCRACVAYLHSLLLLFNRD